MINSPLQGPAVHRNCRTTRPRPYGVALLPSLLVLVAVLAGPAESKDQLQSADLQQVYLTNVLRDYQQYLDQVEEEQKADDALSQYHKRQGSYAFGLGKRRQDYAFGLGKRSPDYAFGLGKRVQDYAFGLGKRSSNDYSFGLGKRSGNDYSFGLGKRAKDFSFGLGKRDGAYSFGLGKRVVEDDSDVETETNKLSPPYYPKFKSYSMGLGKRSIKESDLAEEREKVEEGQQDANEEDVRHKRDVTSLDESPDAAGFADPFLDEKRNNMYEFGLGKREFGSHKYNFGLGKREYLLAPDDEEYDHPKRTPNQYSFGLGKRAGAYEFGLGKRLSPEYNFGIGKRYGRTQMTAFSRPESGPAYEYYKSKQPKVIHPFGFGRRSFDFGIGKRSGGRVPNYTPPKRPSRDFAFGLGKRGDVGAYGFGLGKREYEEDAGDSLLDQDRYVLQEFS